VGVGGELVAAAQALAASTGELRAAAADISPALAKLAPQLGALAREVALLAAQAEEPESGNAVLDMLVHLGEDVERLVALAQPTAGEGAGP
jgi:ABC-type transporter Mla subunit MlaD